MNFEIRQADYKNPAQMNQICQLLNEYASEPMGGGVPIQPDRISQLKKGLGEFPLAFSLIVYDQENPIGLANCFFGFSTFAARKLINIHDLMVSKNFRGKGISQLLLKRIEEIGYENNCVKITLEVLENNEIAKNSYQKFGFTSYELSSETGHALFWQKSLDAE